MRPRQLTIVSVLVLGAAATGCALWLGQWKRELWLPSLACNLFTTAVAIWIINVAVEGQKQAEAARGAEVERKLTAQLVRNPASLGVLIAVEVLQALEPSIDSGMREIEKWRPSMKRLSGQWRDNILFYGRWMDIELIQALDHTQSGLAGLGGMPARPIPGQDSMIWLYADEVLQGGAALAERFKIKEVREVLDRFEPQRDRISNALVKRSPMAEHVLGGRGKDTSPESS